MIKSGLMTAGRLGLVTTKEAVNTYSGGFYTPNTTQVGDLLLLYTGCYSTVPSHPAGWTKIASASGAGTYAENALLSYKIATAAEAGGSGYVGVGTNASYSGSFMVAISGHDPANPIAGYDAAGSATNTTVIETGPVQATAPGKRYGFFAQMLGNGSTPTLTPGAGMDKAQILSDVGGINSGHRAEVWQDTIMRPAAALPSWVLNSSLAGSTVGIGVAIASAR